jgi:polyhydroxybutyrate depolymerase
MHDTGTQRRVLEVAGQPRDYWVHVPPHCRPRMPLVLALHGAGTNAVRMIEFCGLNDKADANDFLVVYPNGTGRTEAARTWNGGATCGYAGKYDIDDVAFFARLLKRLPADLPVDPTRIYATGMSNGALMCYRLAAELSEQLAAIAPIAGAMIQPFQPPRRPVPVIHFHGTQDAYCPYEGGVGRHSLTRTRFLSVAETVHLWVAYDACDPHPVRHRQRPLFEDGTTIEVAKYRGGKEGAEIELHTIHGGGHTWPGRPSPLAFLGRTTRNLSANDAMWEFFQRFRRTNAR